MSSVYNTEPQPTGSAILHTNYGEISIELFAKQTPLTCRNFLQHALDGYYDNTSFHRLVPGFIVQGGDPTGTGNGGESIYDGGAFSGDLDPWPMDERRGKNAGMDGINFKDEFHSRLKFNRRGLLGMANESMPDTNGSQFFFTLAKAPELDGKNTMFGRVAGDTIYNLAKLGEAEVDEGGERPLYSAKIERVEILVNPFEDMKKRERVAKVIQKAPAQEKKSKKRKGGKQLLSFGDEEGDEGEALPILKKPKFDTRVVADDGEQPSAVAKPAKASKKAGKADKKAAKDRESQADARSQSPTHTKPSSLPKKEKPQPQPEYDSDSEPEKPRRKTQLEKTNDEIAALKASMKRTVEVAPVKEKPKSTLEQLIPDSAARGRKRGAGGKEQGFDALLAFRSELGLAPSEKQSNSTILAPNSTEATTTADDDEEGDVCDLHFILNCESCQSWDKKEEKDESDDEGWMNHALNAAADRLGKDLSYRKKAVEELIVIDPREKAQALKEGKKGGRDRESNRAWDSHRDQARNAKLSKSAALSGRGAK